MRKINNAACLIEPGDYAATASEAQIQASIVQLLQYLGWMVIETSQVGPVIRMQGLPDILAWKVYGEGSPRASTVTLLCEVKRKGWKPRRSQVKFFERIRPLLSVDFWHCYAYSVEDISEVLAVIDKAHAEP